MSSIFYLSCGKRDLLFSALFFSFMIFSVLVYSNEKQFTVTLDNADVSIGLGSDGFAKFSGEDIQFLGEVGDPSIPHKIFKIILPANADLSSVRVKLESPKYEQMSGLWRIKPIGAPTYWNGRTQSFLNKGHKDIVAGKNTSIYNNDFRYPYQLLKSNYYVGQQRKWKVLDISLPLFSYAPISKKVYRNRNVKALISYNLSSTPHELTDTLADDEIRRQAINFTEMAGDYSSNKSNSSLPAYVVLTTKFIKDSSKQLKLFAENKRQFGYEVYIKTESDWGAGKGDIAAEKIRFWLKANYQKLNIKYLLLIGDPDTENGLVPMKMLWPRNNAEVAISVKKAPSDIYYSDLTGDWDLDKDNRFGEWPDDFGAGGCDLNPELIVGRIPFYNDIDSLDSILKKSISYQDSTMLSTAWRKKLLLPMAKSNTKVPNYLLGDAIVDYVMPADGSWKYQKIYGDSHSFDLTEKTIPATKKDIVNEWAKNKYGVVVLQGNGNSRSTLGVIDTRSVASLDDSHPAFVFHAANYNSYPEYKKNLALSLLKNGAIATVAPTRELLSIDGERNFDSSSSAQGIAYRFSKNLVGSAQPCGDSLATTVSSLKPNSAEELMNLFSYALYGDPALGVNSSRAQLHAAKGVDPALDGKDGDISLQEEKLDLNVDISVGSDGFAKFSGQDLEFTADTGEPSLPTRIVKVLLPPTAELNSLNVELSGVELKELPGDFKVKPSPPPAFWDGKKVVVDWPGGVPLKNGQDPAVFGKNEPFPSNLIGDVQVGEYHQWKIVEIPISLLQYNPTNQKLYKLVKGTPVVKFKHNLSKVSKTKVSSSLLKMSLSRLEGSVINFNEAISAYTGGSTSNSGSSSSGGGGGSGGPAAQSGGTSYAIITTNAIVAGSAEFANFVALKQLRGFNVVVATEDQWGGGRGNSAANNIRNWLKNNYAALSIEYVLLMGNPHPSSGDVPMKMLWPRNNATRYTQYKDSPSDYFYADLTGNWDRDGDGKYGEWSHDFGAGGIDRYYEVVVGRIPFYGNFTDLDSILAKTITYQTVDKADIAWRKHVLLPMEPSDSSTPGYHLGEAIKNVSATPKGYTSYRIYDSSYGVGPEKTPCNPTNVLNGWKSTNPGAVFWWTHGNQYAAADIMTVSNAAKLDDSKPAFTFQCSCLNSYPELSNNLTYSILKNGGIVTVGGTRVTWYYPGQTNFSNTASNGGFTYRYAKNLILSGQTSGYALHNLKENISVYSDSLWMNYTGMLIYGDPECGIDSHATTPPKTVTCSLAPSEAVNAGAKWRMTTGIDSNWKNSGDQISNVPTGSYTVEFLEVSGWTKPASQTITVTDSGYVNITGTYTGIAIVTDQGTVTIPEGENSTVRLKLSGKPLGNVIVAVSRKSGDPDISVSAGASLIFTPSNWNSYQDVTLSAAQDPGDINNGTAVILCSSISAIDKEISAVEVDNDTLYGLSLSNNSVQENQEAGTLVGTLISQDTTENDSHTFVLVAGDGSADNSKFSISGNQLKTAEVFDFEITKQCQIRVKVTDGDNESYEKSFSINIVNKNETPSLSVDPLTKTVDYGASENLLSGVTATDIEDGDISNRVITSGILNTTQFGDQVVKYDVTDLGGLSAQQKSRTYTIINHKPTEITLTGNTVAENKAASTAVGTLSVADQDANEPHRFTLVAGTGDTGNGKFILSGNSLKTREELDYESATTHSIRVRATDTGGLHTERAFAINVLDLEDTTNLIMAVSDNSHGATTPSVGSSSANVNRPVPISAEAKDGYHFDSWTVTGDGVIADLNAISTTVQLSGNTTVTANFKANGEGLVLTSAINVSDIATITPLPGEHTVYKDQPIVLNADVPAGYKFMHWKIVGGGRIAERKEPNTTVRLIANATVTAVIEKNADTEATLILAASPEGAGETDPGMGAHTVGIGKDQLIAANAKPGYHFLYWSVSGGASISDTAGKLTNVKLLGDATVTAYFEVNDTTANLTMTSTPEEGGTTTPARGTKSVNIGERIPIAYKATDGYHFTGWLISGQAAVSGSFVTLTGDATVTAAFEKNDEKEKIPLTLAVAPSGSGTTVPAIGRHDVYAGESVAITAQPADGHTFDYWQVSGGGFVADIFSPSTTVRVEGQATVTAMFYKDSDEEQATLTIGVSSPDAGNTNPGVGQHKVAISKNIPITAKAHNGYQFVKWEVNGAATVKDILLASTQVTLTGNGNVTAVFKEEANFVSVHLGSTPEGVAVTLPWVGTGWSRIGDTFKICAIAAKPGYYFDRWDITGSATYKDGSITIKGDTRAIAVFKEESEEKKSLTLKCSPEEGGATNPGAGVYELSYGEKKEIVAIAKQGYHFVSWIVSGGGTVGSPASASTNVSLVGDATVTALFEKNSVEKHLLTMKATPEEAGATNPGIGSHLIRAQEKYSIEASPAEGYRFKRWIVEGSGALSDIDINTANITITAPTTVTAEFAPIGDKEEVFVTISSEPVDAGSTTPGTGTHKLISGDTIDLQAFASDGYFFSRWDVGSGAILNGSKLTVSSDVDVVAKFAKETDDKVNLTITGSPENAGSTNPGYGTIAVNKNQIIKIDATALTGYHFVSWTIVGGGQISAPLSASTTVTLVSDATVTAIYEEDSAEKFNVTINVEPKESGSTSPGVGVHSLNAEQRYPLSATAADGYHFVRWQGADGAAIENLTSAESAVIVSSETAITAHFEKNDKGTFILRMKGIPNNVGAVTPAKDRYDVEGGVPIEIQAVPKDGWYLEYWRVVGSAIVEDIYAEKTTVVLNGDADVTAMFTKGKDERFDLTLAVQPEEAGVTNPGVGVYKFEQKQWIPISTIAAEGYHFKTWMVEGGLKLKKDSELATSVRLTGNGTMTAVYEKDTQETTLTVKVSDEKGGSTKPSVGEHVVQVGQTIALEAVPAQGYYLAGWLVDGNSVIDDNLLTINGATTVTADFRKSIEQATLTMITDPEGSGATTPALGTHIYSVGETVKLKNIASDGYHFIGWAVAGQGVLDGNSVALNGNTTVTAQFEKSTRDVNLTIAISKEGKGSVNPGVGIHKYQAGEIVPITAVAQEGYRFVKWSLNGSVTFSSGSLTDSTAEIKLTGDATVTAVIEKTAQAVTLKMRATPDNTGNTNPGLGTHQMVAGQVFDISAVAQDGFHFTHWEIKGAAQFWECGGEFKDCQVKITGDAEIIAHFSEDKSLAFLTMKTTPSGGGSVTPGKGVHEYNIGEVVNISATPAAGYRFVIWTIIGDAELNKGSCSSQSCSVKINGNATLTATFAKSDEDVTLVVQSQAGGSTDPGVGEHNYSKGEIIQLNAVPDTGYKFDRWILTGGAVYADGNGSTALSNVQLNGDAVVMAEFSQVIQNVEVTMDVSPEIGGSTSPGVGKHIVGKGQGVPVSALAADGYSFIGWDIKGSATIKNGVLTAKGDATVTAKFEKESGTGKLTISVSPENAGATNPGIGIHNINLGAPQPISATAAPGYYFVGWQLSGSGQLGENSITLTGDAELIAVFEELVEEVALSMVITPADKGFTSPGIGVHMIPKGKPQQISASAVAGYHFDRWIVNGGATIDGNTVTLNSDATVTAKFVKNVEQVLLTLKVSPEDSGSTNPGVGNHPINKGEPFSLAYTPAKNYVFVGWTINSGGASLEGDLITLSSDATVTANFERSDAANTLVVSTSPQGAGHVNPGVGIHNVVKGETKLFTATGLEGYHFTGWSVEGAAKTENLSFRETEITILGDAKVTALFEVNSGISNLELDVAPDESGTTNPGEWIYPLFNGAPERIEAQPEFGFHFTGWVTDGQAIVDDLNSVDTVVTITDNSKVTANYEANTGAYALTMAVNSAKMGATNPGVWTYTVNAGESRKIEATPLPNHHFVRWEVSAGVDIVSAESIKTSVKLTADATVEAIFEPTIGQSAVQIQVFPPEAGYTNPGVSSYSLDIGAAEAISARPNPGWIFSKWTATGDADFDNPLSSDTSVVVLDSSTLVANFEREVPLAVVTPNGGETVTAGTTLQITWGPVKMSSAVKIELYKGRTFIRTLAQPMKDTGTFDWFIPKDHVTGDDFVVKVTRVNVEGQSDVSDADFSILEHVKGKLVASNGSQFDLFASSVDYHGNVIVSGAPNHKELGAAYIYRYNGINWFEEEILGVEQSFEGDKFGFSVATNGSWVAVGAPYAEGGTGAVYIYQYSNDSWTLTQKILSPKPVNNGQFGFDISMSNHSLAVGSPAIGGDGAVYTYELGSGNWRYLSQLKSNTPSPNDQFGASVDCSGNYIVSSSNGKVRSAFIYKREGSTWSGIERIDSVSAERHVISSVSIDSNLMSFGQFTASGNLKVQVYRLDESKGDAWIKDGEISVDGADSASQIAVSGVRVVVGTQFEDGKGAVLVFHKGADKWVQVRKNIAFDGKGGDQFGHAIALYKNNLVVGANNTESSKGSAYVYTLEPVIDVIVQPQGAAVLTNKNFSETKLGERIDISVTPATGFVFSEWIGHGDAYVLNPKKSSTQIHATGDGVFYANLLGERFITLQQLFSLSDTNAVTSISSKKYNPGTVVPISAEGLAKNYKFVKWEVIGDILLKDSASSQTTATINSDGSIKAVLMPDTSNRVKLSVEPAGTGVIPQGDVIVADGKTAISINPNKGYLFENWTYSNGVIIEDATAPSTTFNTEFNSSITANLSKGVILETSVTPAGTGTTSVVGYKTYRPGSTVEVRAKASKHYRFTYWTINGVPQNANKLNDPVLSIQIDKDTSVVANFERIVRLTVVPSNKTLGEVAPSLTLELKPGETTTIKAMSYHGTTFSKWTSSSAAIISHPYKPVTTVKVRDDATVVASFIQNTASDPGPLLFVDYQAKGDNNGSSWTNAYTNLSDALDAIRPYGEIWIAQGTYKPAVTLDRTASFTMKEGVKIYGGFKSGQTRISDRDIKRYTTVLSGEFGKPDRADDNSYHVVTGAHNALLNGLTISGGTAMDNSGAIELSGGGGLRVLNGSMTISKCIFKNNDSVDVGNNSNGMGGAIYAAGKGFTLNIDKTVFSDNNAQQGGAISAGGHVNVTNCVFALNSAVENGGAIYNGPHNANTKITNCTFYGNTAGGAGATVYSTAGSLTVTNVVSVDDKASGSGGYTGDLFSVNGTLNVSYSCFYQSDSTNEEYAGTDNVNTDPFMVDPSLSLYQLENRSDSPAIDKGTSSGAPVDDIYGNKRVQNKVDRGAFEYYNYLKTPTNITLESASVEEYLESGTLVSVFSVDDLDIGDVHTFRLVDGPGSTDNDKFQVDGYQLRTNGFLVYDDTGANNTLSIRIEATDTTGKTISVPISVNITDNPNLPPIFSITNSDISEYRRTGFAVGTMSTVGFDTSNILTYSFVDGDGDDDNALFSIDDDVVNTEAMFIYDSSTNNDNTRSVRVRVENNYGLGFDYNVDFEIKDVTNMPPIITLTQDNVDEGVPLGTNFADISVDGFPFSTSISYSLITGAGDEDNDDITLVGNKLTTNAVMDHLVDDELTIRLKVEDDDQLAFYAPFSITVNDLVNAPDKILLVQNASNKAAKNQYGKDFEVDEGISGEVGTFVASITDSVTNEVTYFDPDTDNTIASVTLVPGTGDTNNGDFEIVTVGSDIILRLAGGAVFDFEAIRFSPFYSLRVRLTNNEGLFVDDIITIAVHDRLNEGTPTDLTLSATAIAEDSPAGTEVGTFTTTDVDDPQTYTYSLVAGDGVNDADNGAFSIIGNKLKVNGLLDYETQQAYAIRVRTEDPFSEDSDPSSYWEESFIISVTDVNEGVPTSMSLTPDTIDENLAPGTVGTLSSTDTDTLQTTTYTLSTDTVTYPDNAFFTITGNSLVSNISFDHETKSSYSVRVIATDNGVPANSSEKTFTVNIADVNEGAPTTITVSSQAIDENKSASVIGTLSTDDTDLNQSITYTLVSVVGDDDAGDYIGSFDIVGDSLRSAVALDHEINSSYTVRINADDGTSNVTVPITIAVNDLNEAPIVANPIAGVITVPDSTATEDLLYEYTFPSNTFDDLDAGDDESNLTYTLTSNLGWLTIDSATKKISGTPLNGNVGANVVEVVASDGSLSASTQFTINVNNVNDPITDFNFNAEDIADTTPIGSTVGTVVPVDEDTGDTYTFEFDGGADDAMFNIGLNTGVVTLASGIPTIAGLSRDYNIKIKVTDPGAATISKDVVITAYQNTVPNLVDETDIVVNEGATATLSLRLIDVLGKDHTYDLTCSKTIGAPLSITVSDPPASPVITVKDGDDINVVNSPYPMTLTVTDKYGSTDSVTFNVTVNNVQEKPTQIIFTPSGTIYEDTPFGTTVGTLSVVDPDQIAGISETYVYNVNPAFSGAMFDNVGNVVKKTNVTPIDSDTGYTGRVNVTDGAHTFSQNVTIIVYDRPPTISGTPLTTVNEGDLYQYTFTGTGSGISYSFSPAVSWLSMSGSTLRGTPTNDDIGTTPDITVTVTDDEGSKASLAPFSITVVNVNIAPTALLLDNTSVRETVPPGTKVGTMTSTDVDFGDTFTYSITEINGDANPANFDFEVVGDVLQTKNLLNNGPYTILLRTTDAAGAFFEQSFAITLTPAILYVNSGAVGSNDGSSWVDAFTDLQSALVEAADGDQLWIAQGTYYTDSAVDRTKSFLVNKDIDFYGGFNGTESLLTERDPVNNTTILSADIGVQNTTSDNSYHVMVLETGSENIVIDGFTIRDGNGLSGGQDTYDFGGAIYNDGMSPTISNCIFTSNNAVYGGAIYNSGGSTTITDCQFIANTADSKGAAVVNTNSASLTVTSCEFKSNGPDLTANGDYDSQMIGGAIYNDESANVSIDKTLFTDNTGEDAAGAIYSTGNTTLSINDTLFQSNSAVNNGGALYNVNIDSCSIVNSVFYTNSVSNIINGNAGAIFNYYSETEIVNTTFVGNTSFRGSSIANYTNATTGQSTVTNSIVWNSTPPIEQIYDFGDTPLSVSYSDVQGGYSGTGVIDSDPLFSNIASPLGVDTLFATIDDGLTLTVMSPCVGSGTTGGAPANDILGNPLVMSSVDMGPYSADFKITGITLSNNYLQSGQPNGTTVGTLTVTPASSLSRTLSVISGGGYSSEFTTSGSDLVSVGAVAEDNYKVLVRAADAKGNSFEQSFTIKVAAAETVDDGVTGTDSSESIEQFILVDSPGSSEVDENNYTSGGTGANAVFKVKFDDISAGDKFGTTVAIDGNYAVVGSPLDDDAGTDAGAVYIFRYVNSNWESFKLIPSYMGENLSGSKFGSAVAVFDDIVVVGAPGYSTDKPDAGSAFVYQKDQGGTDNWGMIAILKAPTPADSDNFGAQVQTNGTVVAVSSILSDAAGTDTGSVYIFDTFNAGTLTATLRQTINSPVTSVSAMFGKSISLSGDILAVGQGSNASTGSKNVYIYSRDTGGTDAWGKVSENNYLQTVGQGMKVAVNESQGKLMVSGSSNGTSQSVYIYDASSSAVSWSPVTTINIPAGDTDENFGFGLALTDDTVIVTDPAHSSVDFGSVYTYDYGTSTLKTEFSAPIDNGDAYGYSVDAATSWILIGAPQDDVDGTESGAVYFIRK